MQLKELRRVVTGIDAAGKSYVAIDGPPANIRESDGRGAAEFWITDATPADNAASGDPAAERSPRLEPPVGGSVIRYFMVAPENKGAVACGVGSAKRGAVRCDGRFALPRRYLAPSEHAHHADGRLHHRAVRARHAAARQGEVELKPFDVVVQRGTNHGWVNRGTEPAVMAAILIDAKPL